MDRSCPVCKNNNARIFNNSRYFYRSYTDIKTNNFLKNNNYLCNCCGHIWQYPQPPKEKLSELYENQYRKSADKVIYKNKECTIPLQLSESRNSFLRAQAFFEIFEKNGLKFPSKGSILDIGGYQGLFAWTIGNLSGLNAKVIDFNAYGLKFASSFLGINTKKIEFDIVDSLKEEQKGSYFLITMIHSLEHTPNPESIIKSSRNLLQRKGYIYIEVPNSSGSGLNDPTHLHTFSLESLRYMLKINDFEIISIRSEALAHEAEAELQNKNVVLRTLARKKISLDKKNFSIKNKKQDMAKQINIKLTHASLTAIYLMFKKLIQSNINFFLKVLIWFAYDYIPGAKKIINKVKSKFKGN